MGSTKWRAVVIVSSVWFGGAARADVVPVSSSNETLSGAAEPPDGARWPRAVFERPLTLPAGLVLAGPDMLASHAETGTTVVGDLNVGVGITDEIELNTLTPTGAFTIKNPDFAGPWDAGLGVAVVRGALGGRLEVIARAVAGYDFEAHAARAVRLGVQAQFNVADRVAVLVHDTGVMPGVTFDAFGSQSVSLGLPVGIGVQLHPLVWVEADTNVVTSYSLHAMSQETLADVAPVFGTAVLNVDHGALDVLAYGGATDCYRAASTYFIGVGARYYAGAR